MLSGTLVIFISFAYLLLLFAIAHWADWRCDRGRSVIANPIVYALSLAVYCTAWTYYGSVGRAAVGGAGFLPVYLGPTLAMMLCMAVLLKMLRIAKTYRITSIADFIASRYGKSHLLGGFVTLIAVIGIIPYIALQLKAIAMGLSVLIEPSARPILGEGNAWWQDGTLYVAMTLALFSVLFGTRHLDTTERHEGLVAAIAFESLIKLGAFLAVGFYVTYVLFNGFSDVFAKAAAMPELQALFTLSQTTPGGYVNWFTVTILSLVAFVLLPRQFQVMVVENVNESHLKRAAWMLPMYLLLINLFVLPIALGGLLHYGGQGPDPDTFVLMLPVDHGQQALALFAFVGGLSAATGMVIVETIALSTMVCNDLIMPWLLRQNRFEHARHEDLHRLLLGIRRMAIVLIMFLGYLYFRLAGEAYALVSIGLISFAAVAQFAPAMVGALYWRGATRQGALAGLLAGFAIWVYCLLLPSFAKSGWLPPAFMNEGLFGWSFLQPEALFGLSGFDPLSHALFWSWFFNIGAFVLVSLYRPPDGLQASQAMLFVDIDRRQHANNRSAVLWRGRADVGGITSVVARFLGQDKADRLEKTYHLEQVRHGQERALSHLVPLAETQLAGAIGSTSARALMASVVREEPLDLEEVMEILDEASQIRAYSHKLEEKSTALQKATDELRSANERLKELDRLKDDFMSSVTHELRTPLTSIRAFSELLYDDPNMDIEDRKRFLGIIVAETERLTRLVNQVLDMAKLESGNADWDIHVHELAPILDHALASIGQLFRDKSVKLICNSPKTPVFVAVDRDRLVQVVLNLVGNALKFVRTGEGEIQVELISDGLWAHVAVKDNGPGILPEDQPLIFEKFRQGGDSLTGKPQGTGLGLPISRQIIEHFGGSLKVESDPAACPGAAFIFDLPCCPQPH
jgi:Na+/proline symporter/nitrogen-specific signal transduction histidine kinase